MKRRELERELKNAGARPERIRGSHHMWRLADGTLVTFSVKGTHSDISVEDVARVRRGLKGKDGRQEAAKDREKRDRRRRRRGDLPAFMLGSVISEEKRHGAGRRRHD